MIDRISGPTKHFYEFGVFRIDVNKRLLLKDGETVPLTPKAFDTLLLLVENSGQLVSKDALMSRLWPDTVVEEGSLTRNVYVLRKALGEAPQEHKYIVTVPGQGYRFVAEVREVSEDSLDLRVTERTHTTIIVSEEETEDLYEMPLVQNTAYAPTLTLEAGRTSSHPSGGFGKYKTAIAVGALMVIVTLGVVIWLYSSGRLWRPEAMSAEPSSRMAITNLTSTDNIVCMAISPDGNYVAYAQADSLKQNSLWIMQLATFTGQSVIPPAEVQYHALTFSPDGNYIYYVMKESDNALRALYRVSLLGGPSKKVLGNVETAISFSPDGSQLVFRRGANERRESTLLIANADGTDEKEVAAIKYPEGFSEPAWSPDGKTIVSAAGHAMGGINMYVVRVSLEDGSVEPVSSKRWQWVGRMSWLSDSSGLMMVASEDPAAPYQVWHLRYPSGETRKVTNDSSFYNNLSMSADSGTLLVMKRELDSKVWTIPADNVSRAKQLTFGSGGHRMKLSWTSGNKIVYDSSVGNSTSISIMDADGNNPKHLMGDMTGRARVHASTVTADGRYIVYVSDLTGTRHIWRMNIDGSNAIQLTDGAGEDQPVCSPDGKWVFYVSMEPGMLYLQKVPIEGGESVKLSDLYVHMPAVSPDGRLIACLTFSGDTPWRIAIFPVEGGQPVNFLPNNVQGATALRWTPDGRALTYSENPIGSSRIWIQPLAGGPPRKLIELETDRIFDFDWSPDGKHFACIRGIWARNIIMVKNFR
jgi:Tol biopolymer transport system component/DNA-binding winged helix-turn-helix (wHTH) protein